eukprot:s4826_g2.t1
MGPHGDVSSWSVLPHERHVKWYWLGPRRILRISTVVADWMGYQLPPLFGRCLGTESDDYATDGTGYRAPPRPTLAHTPPVAGRLHRPMKETSKLAKLAGHTPSERPGTP